MEVVVVVVWDGVEAGWTAMGDMGEDEEKTYYSPN